jgi:hypothetical protein
VRVDGKPSAATKNSFDEGSSTAPSMTEILYSSPLSRASIIVEVLRVAPKSSILVARYCSKSSLLITIPLKLT